MRTASNTVRTPALCMLTVIVALHAAGGNPRALGQCQMAKLLASPGAEEQFFGYSVALAGNRALVGKPLDFQGGSVYVFERSDGQWVKVDELSTGVFANGFGWSVAVDGGTAVIGASGDSTIIHYGGAACFFDLVNDRWVQVDKVWPSDTFESQRFGHAAALDGDGAVITAWNSSNGQAYVFERDPNGKWIEKSKLMPVGSLGVSYYGRCAALHGNVAVVGAPSDDQFGFAAGAAHVFERDQSGAWKHVVKLVEPDTAPDAVFGSSVAVRGETIIVGALGAKYGSIPSAGAVYVYTRTGPGQWTKTAKLFAADPANSDGFGNAVSLSGDIAVIGALGDDEQAFQAGAVYVFHRQRGGWKQIAKLLAADGDAGDLLTDNNVLAVDGSFCIAGAINDQPYGEFSGSAYIFAVGPDVDGDGLMDACECPGDIDKDWTVDQGDLGILLADYGCTGKMPVPPNPGDCPGDLDADGDTDQSDLGILLANYAAICP